MAALQPAQAWASSYPDKQVTITVGSDATDGIANADAKYAAYYIFKANFKDSPNEASNIAWAGSTAERQTAVKNAINGALSAYATAHNQTYTATDAYSAAQFIKDNWATGENLDTASSTQGVAAAKTLPAELAKAVVNASLTADKTVTTTGDATKTGTLKGPEGYWLVLTDEATLTDGTNEAAYGDDGGTAPMWVALGGVNSAITAKDFKPVATFQVLEDSTNSYGLAADASLNEAVTYKAVGTLPKNLSAYDTFYDKYTITLPAGLTYVEGSAKAYVGTDETTLSNNTEITNPTLSGQVLTLEISDVKTLSPAPAASSKIYIEYQAKPNESSTIGTYASSGQVGNPTTLAREYSSNPANPAHHSAITPQTVRTYTYLFTGVKIDKNDGAKLAGARFSIKDGNGKYLKTTGEVGDIATEPTASDTAYVFTSQESTGQLNIAADARFDAGDYTIHELEAPNSYNALDTDITLSITRTLPTVAGSTDVSLGATASGGEAASEGAHPLAIKSVDAVNQTSNFTIEIPNEKSITMPLTGMNGYLFATIAGFALMAGGLGGIFVLRRARGKRQDL